MERLDAGLSSGTECGLAAGFLAGQIQRDYMSSVVDAEGAVGFELQYKTAKKSPAARTTDPTCGCQPKPRPKPKPKPKPKYKASWFTTPEMRV